MNCSIKDCVRLAGVADKDGYCNAHRQRVRKGRDVNAPMRPPHTHKSDVCTVDDCSNPHSAKGFCYKHYGRNKRGVDLNAPDRRPLEMWGKWYKNNYGYLVRHRRVNGKSKTQSQHRHVMEEHLGRKLRPEETVHHINGVRDDNSIENLELWSTSHPKGQRVQDKVRWAHEMLKIYSPESLK